MQVLQWVEDYRDALLREALRAFLAGEMDQLILNEHRGRALMCSELAVLRWEDVLRWYGLEGVVPVEGFKA